MMNMRAGLHRIIAVWQEHDQRRSALAGIDFAEFIQSGARTIRASFMNQERLYRRYTVSCLLLAISLFITIEPAYP